MHEPFPGASSLALPAVTFIAGLVTKGFIENQYARSLESLKGTLKNEESTLEFYRNQLDTSRGVLFSRSSARAAMIEQKRLEHAQALWDHYVALTPFRTLEFIAKAVDFDKMTQVAARSDSQATRLKEFATIMLGFSDGAQAYLDSKLGLEANKLQLFTDDDIWETYQTYRSAVMLPYIKLKLLSIGTDLTIMKTATDLIDRMKRLLPEFENYISENGENAFPYVYSYLERKLVGMLKSTFGAKTVGDIADLNEINRAMDSVKFHNIDVPNAYANTAAPPVV